MSTPSPHTQFIVPTSGPGPHPFDATLDLTAGTLAELIPHWQLALRAQAKACATINLYTSSVERYLSWCQTTGRPPIVRTTLETWMVHLLQMGNKPGTVRVRQQAVRRFGAWLTTTGQIPGHPFVGIKGPAQRTPAVQPLSDDELRALIRTCTHPTHSIGETFQHRRDEAIIRLMMETGIRGGELLALHTDDLDLPAGRVLIRVGKGGRSRAIPIGPTTTRAIFAYLVERQQHPAAEEPTLWFGVHGVDFGYDGLIKTLRRRATLARVRGFHPHRLRHTAAHRWLAHGGSESGLMAIAGWTRTDMLVRYTRATAAERAANEAQRLNLGDL